jgi:hypothetical protein
MKFRPIHKRTGREYPVITETERQKNWSRPPYSTNFIFQAIEEAPKPEAVKPAQPKQEVPISTGLNQPKG